MTTNRTRTRIQKVTTVPAPEPMTADRKLALYTEFLDRSIESLTGTCKEWATNLLDCATKRDASFIGELAWGSSSLRAAAQLEVAKRMRGWLTELVKPTDPPTAPDEVLKIMRERIRAEAIDLAGRESDGNSTSPMQRTVAMAMIGATADAARGLDSWSA